MSEPRSQSVVAAYSASIVATDLDELLRDGWPLHFFNASDGDNVRVAVSAGESEIAHLPANVRRVALAGDFNTGKTTLFNALAGIELPAGHDVHTPGLCLRQAKLKGTNVLLIDTKGENSPVDICTDRKLEAKPVEELALRCVAHTLATDFVYVTRGLSAKDQLTLRKLCKSLPEGSNAQVFVVHVNPHLTTVAAIQKYVDTVAAKYPAGCVLRTQFAADGRVAILTLSDQKTGTEPATGLSGQKHFVMGCNAAGTESAEYNRAVLKALHVEFDVPYSPSAPPTNGRGAPAAKAAGFRVLDELAGALAKHLEARLEQTGVTLSARIEPDSSRLVIESNPQIDGGLRIQRTTLGNHYVDDNAPTLGDPTPLAQDDPMNTKTLRNAVSFTLTFPVPGAKPFAPVCEKSLAGADDSSSDDGGEECDHAGAAAPIAEVVKPVVLEGTRVRKLFAPAGDNKARTIIEIDGVQMTHGGAPAPKTIAFDVPAVHNAVQLTGPHWVEVRDGLLILTAVGIKGKKTK